MHGAALARQQTARPADAGAHQAHADRQAATTPTAPRVGHHRKPPAALHVAAATRLLLGLLVGISLAVDSRTALASNPSTSTGEAGRLVAAKGPYLQAVEPTAITIMWQAHDSREPGVVVVRGPKLTAPLTVTPELSAKLKIATAVISGLAPSSRYQYEVVIGNQRVAGEFATAPVAGSPSPFRFAVFGDSRWNAESHRRVIERVRQQSPDFVLGTGDMVDDGAKQDQWQTFFDVERPLMASTVVFPSVGNHDRQGRARSADNYRELFAVPNNGFDNERYYWFRYGNSVFVVLDSNSHAFALTDQTAWLERQLSSARQDVTVQHIFVVMHHPPYSISLHGGHRELRERWTPIFEKYAVSAVFSGHDHVYERAEHNGLRYFVSGGGGAPLYAKNPRVSALDKAAVKIYERTYHMLDVTVSGDQLQVTALRPDGSVIEQIKWRDQPPPTAGVTPMVASHAAPPASGGGQPYSPTAEPTSPSGGSTARRPALGASAAPSAHGAAAGASAGASRQAAPVEEESLPWHLLLAGLVTLAGGLAWWRRR